MADGQIDNSLSDIQIKDLAKRMGVELAFCGFKNELLIQKKRPNCAYILNMEDEFDSDGTPNSGSHWVCLVLIKHPNGRKDSCYFDSYGAPPPESVKKFVGKDVPYSSKDIQSLMGSVCGYYCLAFAYWCLSYDHRTCNLCEDAQSFTDLFEDLNVSTEWKKNEWLLKHFFQSADPGKRKPINVF